MVKNPRVVLIMLLILTVLLVVIDLPENYPLKFNFRSISFDRILNPPEIDVSLPGMRIRRNFVTHLGLDLAGGTHIVLEADMRSVSPDQRDTALESAKGVIERRVNFFGLSEPVVQTAKSAEHYRIIVELPGVKDTEIAVRTIGQTARLELREFTDTDAATGSSFIVPSYTNTKPVNISGSDLKRAQLAFSSQTGEPEVAIEFTPEGAKKFADVTGRLVGKYLPIFLDDYPLTWPRVNTVISDGQAVITGSFTKEGAKTLALQLNAGALPVPVSVIEKRTVGATLGSESVTKGVRAGVVGLSIVAIYMIAQYGWLGVIATAALALYGLLTFAIFRFIPVTLTLPGVTGFLLSVGMAVDSNILIFERYKEELRKRKPWKIAMELGFGKAWDSIRDANFTTIISALILYNPANWQFLPSSGLVRGFAITLLIGVLTSLFTGIVVSRTLIRVFYRQRGTNS